MKLNSLTSKVLRGRTGKANNSKEKWKECRTIVWSHPLKQKMTPQHLSLANLALWGFLMGFHAKLLYFWSRSQGCKHPPFSLPFPFLSPSDSVGFGLGLVVDSYCGDPNLWVDISVALSAGGGGIWICFYKFSCPSLWKPVPLGGISSLTVAVSFVKQLSRRIQLNPPQINRVAFETHENLVFSSWKLFCSPGLIAFGNCCSLACSGRWQLSFLQWFKRQHWKGFSHSWPLWTQLWRDWCRFFFSSLLLCREPI